MDPVDPPPRLSAVTAYVALGSNLGNPAVNILAAMDELDRLAVAPSQRSSLWRSTPVDCPPGSPGFVNAVVGLAPQPDESPESLLDKLLALERQFGARARAVLNAPRHLDLDLISFGQERRNDDRLVLPHPRARGRRFVLAPLAEIAPDLVLPGETLTIAELLAGLATSEIVERVAPRPRPSDGSASPSCW